MGLPNLCLLTSQRGTWNSQYPCPKQDMGRGSLGFFFGSFLFGRVQKERTKDCCIQNLRWARQVARCENLSAARTNFTFSDAVVVNIRDSGKPLLFDDCLCGLGSYNQKGLLAKSE